MTLLLARQNLLENGLPAVTVAILWKTVGLFGLFGISMQDDSFSSTLTVNLLSLLMDSSPWPALSSTPLKRQDSDGDSDNSRLFSTLKIYRLLAALQRRPVNHFIYSIVHCCYRLLTFLAFIFVPKARHSHTAWVGASRVCGCLWDPPHMCSECQAGAGSDNAEPTLLQPNCHCHLPPLLHVLPVQV